MPFSSFADFALPNDHITPEIEGLKVPDQFYWVRSQDPLLAGMQLPEKATPWQGLHRIGFRWVTCLCSDHPIYDPYPLKRLVSVELCDLDETDLPEDPDLEERAVTIIATAILQKLEEGEGVIVHCAGGRGRTGTVLGSVLVRLGCSPDDVISFLDDVHRSRGKSGWPESHWQSEVVRRAVP